MTTNEIFTVEAERVLKEETERLAKEFEQQAISEALRTRGEPLEVTASDVRRARLRFLIIERPYLPRTELMLRLYLVAGIVLTIAGLFFPLVRPLFESSDPTTRVSLTLVVLGVALTIVSLAFRYYLKFRYEMQSRGKLELYEQERLDAEEKK